MTASAPIRIALGAVVLDRPDSSGCYFAEDAVGGWSYLITDQDGDYRFRGDGSCQGGLDAALRWALLAAISQMPECRQIRLLLANRQMHAVMVRLSQVDELVITAISGRGITMLIRPEERSVQRAMTAAEQAAAVVLRDRARSEQPAAAMAARQWAAAEQRAQSKRRAASASQSATAQPMAAWRSARAGRPPQPVTPDMHIAAEKAQAGRLASVVAPLMNCLWVRRRPPGNPVIASWMNDLDTQVAMVKSHLEGVGA